MKHYGVVHGRTSGYNNEVRKLLGQLKAFLDATNQKFGVRKKLLEDGAEVRVSIIMNGAVPIYKAMVIPAEESTGQIIDYIFMESGLCRGLGVGPSFGTEMYYTASGVAAAGATSLSYLDWFYFDTTPGSTPTSQWRPYVAGMDSIAVYNETQLNNYTVGINMGAQSGKSLLLWQVTVGTRNIPRSDYTGETLPD